MTLSLRIPAGLIVLTTAFAAGLIVMTTAFAAGAGYPSTEVEGKQLTAMLGASSATASPGQRISLTIDIDLNPGMHVYAPGVDGYIPIEWKMQNSAAATVRPVMFPRSEKLYLKAIDETVPAYQNHFRLTRQIIVAPAGKTPGKLTVAGSLRYQACDDRVCYIPQQLQLVWNFPYHHQR